MSWSPSRILLLLCFTLISSLSLRSQCSGGTSAGALTPTSSWQTLSITDGTYRTFTVVASGCNFPTYYFSLCAADGGSAGYDTQITIINNTTLASVAYSDDYCGLQSYISWTPTAAGTYRVLVNNYYCTTGGGPVTLAYKLTPVPAPSNPNFSLSQSATNGATSDCVQLTANVGGQRGCAWNNINNINFGAAFTYDFTVNLGSSDAGADGIAFVMQNDPDGLCTCGDFGGAMGAANIINGLMVEIDTYMNFEDRDDFCGGDWVGCAGATEWDHLDIWTGTNFNPNLDANCDAVAGGERPFAPCAVALKNAGALYNIENGANHIFRISWAPGAPGTLTARVLNAAGTITYGTISYSFTPMAIFGTNTPYFGFTGATGGLSNQQTFCVPAVLLPSALQTFDARAELGRVALSWETEDEQHLMGFRVERSRDLTTWSTVSTVDSKGNHSYYSEIDPVSEAGIYYYRLQMVQKNGAELTSETRTVRIESSNSLSIFPNPSQEGVTLKANGFGDSYEIEVFNSAGELVLHQTHQGEEWTWEASDLAAGVYTLQVSGNGQLATQKWVKLP